LFYSSDYSNPKFENKLHEDLFRKKLGGLELEKQSDGMTALASKLYTTYNIRPPDLNEPNPATLSDVSFHAKGVKLSQKMLVSQDF
jgi:hypothetical protein